MGDNEQLCRAFIDNCPDSVLLIDNAGSIRSANPAAAQMHGYTLAELLAMNIRDLDVSADAQQTVPELLRRFLAAETLRYNAVRQRKDGTTFPVEVSATPLNIGNEVFILAFDRDISERSRTELQLTHLREELAQKSRLVTASEIASGMTHELNQPLAALRLYIDTAVELAAPCASAELHECLRRVTEQLQHTGEILRRMRGIFGRRPTRRELVNINVIVSEVLALLAGELTRSAARITLELDEQMYLVLADGDQIKQVLVNLIRNALEAMSVCEGERQLVICTAYLENEVLVSVSDTGPGLDPAIAKQLFLPFQTTKPTGLGMGLAICRSLIEGLGGHIGLRTSSGNGTTFYFGLPRNTDPAPA